MPMRLPFLLLLMFLAPAALANWTLVGDDSQLTFVSIKKGKVAEVNFFNELQGSISSDGKAQVSIDLAAVETNIPIRNERMQKLLFETTKYAQATVSADINPNVLRDLQVGETRQQSTGIVLSLHGEEHRQSAQFLVTGLADKRILVVTSAPIILNAADYKLLEGIEKLREVAGLNAISPAVPVTVKLVFAQD